MTGARIGLAAARGVRSALGGIGAAARRACCLALLAACCGSVALAAAPAAAVAAGAPLLEEQSVYLGGAETATIEARIEPDGHQTVCVVEYAREEAFAASGWSGASRQPCGRAVEGVGAQTVYAHLSGLEVAAAYRYRVIASSEGGRAIGPVASFSTFGIESFSLEATNLHGEPYTQAGGHPFELVTQINFNTTYPESPPAVSSNPPVIQDAVERDIKLELPPGLIGNPAPFPSCSFHTLEEHSCSPESQVGTLEVQEEDSSTRHAGIYNLQAPNGVAARFGARVNQLANAVIEAHVRSGSDYGIDADSLDITGFGTVTRVTVRLWGVPASPLHDAQRLAPEDGGSSADNAAETPFLSMPTSCGGTLAFAGLSADSYQAIGSFASASQEMPALQGCASVGFAPELTATPTTAAAGSPSGLAVGLRVPQDLAPGHGYESPSGARSSDLRDAVVTLPAGLAVDPSSAAGLGGCTAGQAGLSMPSEVDEEQRIVLEPRLDSSFTLSFQGQPTAPIGAHAGAAAVQAALQALPAVGAGNVRVSGGAGGAFLVRFVGALAGRSVPRLVATAERPEVQRLALENHEAALNQEFSNDSFELAFGGHSTAAKVTATAHLEPEDEATDAIGYIEESSVSAESGALVTGEAISGPGIPGKTRIRLVPGRILLLSLKRGTAYEKGAYTGTYEASLPDTGFPETVRSALEALPSIASVNVAGGPGGESPVRGPQIDSSFTITYTPAAGYAGGPLTATPAIEETPQTLTPSYSPAGSRAVTVSVVQQGGVPHMNGEPARCPPASKIANVKIRTPLLNHELPGALYLASPHDNPFHSLIALYLAVYDPISGVVIKLPGKVSLDERTGQITTSFENSPQLPFSELKVEIFGASEAAARSRAPLSTPETCGSYSATSSLTPWDGNPAATPSSTAFAITGEPGGGACPASEAQAPNAPAFEAGTISPIAGTYSPFVLKLKREDGSQRFGSLNVTLPPGMLGRVAGVEECPPGDIEAAQRLTAEGDGAIEQAHPSCPAGSEVGVAKVGAGSGAPLFVTGRVYFAGPYQGAPFSLVIVTPAIAGPFDLGAVTVRAALFINPATAQVSVKSDQFPSILDGIPLDIRSVDVEMTRPGFTLNPTSCDAMAVTGAETSTANVTAALSDRFQVAGCDTMKFAPAVSFATAGHTSRRDGASLTTRIAYPASAPGTEANLREVKVQLPYALPSNLKTLEQACTAAQFASNPAGCPAASLVGTAKAFTPILPVPLEGPAYFVSNGVAKFPELISVLQGDGVTIELAGETYISHRGVTTTTFASVPDAPISSFELKLPAGEHSALDANGIMCAQHPKMPILMIGQNGAEITRTETVNVTGCPNRIIVDSYSVAKGRVRLKLTVPHGGVLQAGGRGLTHARRRAQGRQTFAFSLRERRRHRLKTLLKLSFRPAARQHGAAGRHSKSRQLKRTLHIRFR
ncbi:MAG: hypothetical protein ACYCUM_04965 [Solirubrobacteraceae bacterium]